MVTGTAISLGRVGVVALALLAAACGGNDVTAPTSSTPLPFVRETTTMRVYHESGDTVDVDWQESYNAWALAQLGVVPPQRVEYRKYFSRDAMGRFTGNATTNGYAEPEQWRFHTIWPRDNHEIIHVYSAMLGRPSDFFNEGIAVALQTDPAAGRLDAVFNGIEVHQACRGYLATNLLPRPLANFVTTTPFRAIQDQTLSYRFAGSFVRFLLDRYGTAAVLRFFREAGGRNETIETIRTRTQSVFTRSLDDLEAEWLQFLR